MKKLFALTVIAAMALTAFAQSPQKMSYQCVVRNSSGVLVANQAIGMKISIIKGSATGSVVFSETYSPNPQTNANGLVTVEIGGGTATVGTFSAIDWAAGPYFLKTETDPLGGTSYTISGTSQLLSVPYALYAKTAANGFSGSYNDLTNRPVLFDGTWTSLTGKPVLFDGTWTSLSGKPAGFTDGIDNVDDADNSITNEIQALSLSGTVLSLSSGGGSVTLPSSGGGDNWGTQTVVTNTTLTGVGTTASPLAVANTVITPSWSRIQGIPAGFADGTDNFDDADNSISNEIQTLNLSGTTLTLSMGGGSVTLPSSGGDDNWGTQTVVTDATLAGNGTTATPLRIADNGVSTLKILNSAVTADKLAVNSVTSAKIAAATVTGDKIAQAGATAGQALKWNGTTWAPANDEAGSGGLTLPFSGSANIDGATLEINNTFFSGLFENPLIGIKGKSMAAYGTGVYGEALQDGGQSRGVYGKVNSVSGIGVLGENYRTIGHGYGVEGLSASDAGTGVKGQANSVSGITYGVYGNALSLEGYGVYGDAPIYGVYGKSTYTQARAVTGEAIGTASIGVMGIATNTSSTGVWGEGANQGVYGVSALSTGKGVLGAASSATGENSGVYGETNSNSGYGVYGIGPFNGVRGTANSTTLAGHGVFGVANSSNGDGVMGYAASGTGVKGETGGVTKSGIYGLATSETGDNFGVTGQSRSSSGTGVLGYSPKFGIYGASTGTTGRAVMGEAQSSNSIGVYGKAVELNSTGVWGEGARYDFYAAGPGTDYGTSSSIRWKKNLTAIPDPIAKIKAIRGLFFDWDEAHGGKHDVGMIAEEVGMVLPEIVDYEENGTDAIGMDYSKITPLLLEAIKEQQKQIEDQQKEIDKLKALINSLVITK